MALIPPPEREQLALALGAFVFPLPFVTALFAFVPRETLGATALGLIQQIGPLEQQAGVRRQP